MTTIEQIDHWVAVAEAAGYQVRYEYFGGLGGGPCRVAGRNILFLDLALGSAEQLDRVVEILLEEDVIRPSEVADHETRRAA